MMSGKRLCRDRYLSFVFRVFLVYRWGYVDLRQWDLMSELGEGIGVGYFSKEFWANERSCERE